MAVKLRALTGRFTSKRFVCAPPTGDFLERIREHYGPDGYTAILEKEENRYVALCATCSFSASLPYRQLGR